MTEQKKQEKEQYQKYDMQENKNKIVTESEQQLKIHQEGYSIKVKQVLDPLQFIQIFVMTDFFTPIEVPASTESHSDKYQLDKFNNDPFSPTTVRIESLSDHRKKIIQWLKNMPIAMRMSKLMYTNKEFSCLLIAMYDRSSRRNQDCLSQFGISYDKQHGFNIMEQRFIAKPNIDLLQAEHKLLSSIAIANRYSTFDSISVDFGLASDINKLFDLFDVIQNGITHEITKINYKNYNQIEDSHLMFFNPTEEDYAVAKTLGAWFVEVIKKNLSVQFLKDCEEQNQKSQKDAYSQTAEQRINKISCSQKLERVKQKAKNFKNYWNRLNLEQRENLVKKVISRDIRKILNDYRHTIRIYGDSFPCIRYCHPEEISQFISNMVRLEGEYLFNELTYIKLEDAVFDTALYQYELMLEIELQIEKSKNKKNQIGGKKNAKLLTKKKVTKNQQKSKKNNKIFEQEKLFSKNQTMSQTSKTVNSHQLSMAPKKKLNVKSTKPKPPISLQLSSSKQTSETTNDQQSDNQYLDEILEQAEIKSSQKMAEQEFNKIVNEFEVKTTKWNKYQQIAINRLASVLQFYHLSYHLFGSFANGLAVCQSDVDVCVDPNIVHFFYASFCSYRDKVIMALQFLQNCFQAMNWAGNFNLITTASVPVLVFEIDLSIVYGEGKNLLFNCAKSQKGPKICIDLTIEPFANTEKQLVPHLGYQSTSLVAEWVSEYQNLSLIVKILKHVLYKKHLNKSFLGGISSYTLTTLAYAYLKTENNKNEQPLMKTLTGFCKFIKQFDETTTIVDIGNIEPFQNKETDKLTVINCLNGKNMTEHCHRFPQIKSLIVDLLQTLISYEAGFNKKQYSKKLRNLFLQ